MLSKHVLRVESVQMDPGSGGNSVEARNKRSKSPPHCRTRGVEYEMTGFVDSRVNRCLELADLTKDTLKHTLRPGLEDSAFTDTDYTTTGALSGPAAKNIMKTLCCA